MFLVFPFAQQFLFHHPPKTLYLSHLNMQLTYITVEMETVVCTHLTLYQIFYSRFNVRVFTSGLASIPLVSRMLE